MAKSGRQYADEVRELRAAGVEFASASNGYLLADAANWSSGQKAAVTRAANTLDIDTEDIEDGGLTEDEGLVFFDDSAGDSEEEFDDIDFMDFDEGDIFDDEEGDTYEEVT